MDLYSCHRLWLKLCTRTHVLHLDLRLIWTHESNMCKRTECSIFMVYFIVNLYVLDIYSISIFKAKPTPQNQMSHCIRNGVSGSPPCCHFHCNIIRHCKCVSWNEWSHLRLELPHLSSEEAPISNGLHGPLKCCLPGGTFCCSCWLCSCEFWAGLGLAWSNQSWLKFRLTKTFNMLARLHQSCTL